MKRHLLLSVLFLACLFGFPQNSTAKVYTNPGQEAALEGNREAAAQAVSQTSETERTQELLTIWKDHVKTLTQERDDAYKEIETLRNQGANTPQNNNSQGMSDAERESATTAINQLKIQVQTLQSENQQLKMAQPRDVASVDQDLKTELGNLRSENQKLKMAIKENSENASDKEVILKEKEDALSQLDHMKNKMTELQKKYDELQSSQNTSQETGADTAQLRALRAKAEKLKVVETELQEARNYFASYMKELDVKNKQLADENNSLKSQIKGSQADSNKGQELQVAVDQLKSENSSLNTENKQLKKIQTQQTKTIQALKSTVQSSLDSIGSNCADTKK